MNTRTLLFPMMICLVLCSLSTSRAQDADNAAIDNFITRQAKREQGEEYRDARKVVTGDLTHDDKPETVVVYTIEGQRGSNLYIQYLAVFVRRNGKLAPLTHADVGGKFTRSVEGIAVDHNSILLDTLDHAPKDAACCPSIKGKARYVLSGATLREQNSATKKHKRLL